MDDLRAVMDAVGIEREFRRSGFRRAASSAMLFAVSHPERRRSLVLYGSFRRGFLSGWGSDEVFDASMKYMDEGLRERKEFVGLRPVESERCCAFSNGGAISTSLG